LYLLFDLIIILHRKAAQSNLTQQDCTPLKQELTALSNLLEVFIGSLPLVMVGESSSSMESQSPSERTRRILVVHSIIGAATIRLHTPFGAGGQSDFSRKRRLNAAREIFGNLIASRGSYTSGRSLTSVVSAGWLNPIIGVGLIYFTHGTVRLTCCSCSLPG